MKEVNPDMYSPAARPSSIRAAPAKNLIWSTIGGISSDAVSASGLPVVCDSPLTTSSALAWTASAIRSRARLRSPGVASRQPSNASAAEENAASTSVSPEIGAVAKASPVLGLISSARLSNAVSVHWPPIKLRSSSTTRPPFRILYGFFLAPRGLAGRGRALLARPRRTIVGEQVEEGLRGQRLGTQPPGAGPGARVDQLQRHDRVDRGLPDHCLGAVLGHRPGVVHHVVQVDLARAAVLAGAGDPEARAGQAAHLVPERGRLGRAGVA